MSLYPQSQGYPQMSYPPTGFAQHVQGPPPGPYSAFQQPQPLYQHQMDPNTFRRDYTSRLAELTINSRPIIQNLSMIAQEYSRWGDIVVQCIEAHIRRAPVWMKLPALYLLDAISKNVFEPYARTFSPFIISLFLDTYAQVDQNIRNKMEEMLITWRTGTPNGKELFGIAPQVAIERGVWGGASASGTLLGDGFHITKSQVLTELQFTLDQKERALSSNPYDTTSQNHVSILQQLRRMVEAGVSQDELTQILNQLRALSRNAPPPPPVLSPQASHPYPSVTTYPQQSFPTPVPQVSYTSSSPPSGSSQPLYPYTSFEQSTALKLPALLPAASGSVSAPLATLPIRATSSSIANLLDTLVKAGVVSSTGTPVGAGSTAQAEEAKPQTIDHRTEAVRSYRETVLIPKIRLTSSEIAKHRPENLALLYERLPIQCKQCAIRFPDDTVGKKRMEDHLDLHFRQNRKASQNIGRGHSRSWFVGVDNWIHDISANIKGKGHEDGSRPLNAKAAAAVEAAKREAELRALHVVVPPGDEAKSIACPICKETLKSEFLEDEEDWVWKNAVKRDDRIYHATCHAEAVSSASGLAARLRNEIAGGGSRSRSATPEGAQRSLRPTPPRGTIANLKTEIRRSASPLENHAGLKRKAENDPEHSDQPPTKKVALSVT